MKTTAALVALVGAASAREISLYNSIMKREVPQEHAHQDILDVINPILKQNNPLNIEDAVFSLLGNAAAAKGAPEVQNLDCLQQIVADQVFTNAKAAGDLNGQINAILFRALERNTAKVGQASVLCTQKAVNPEIAAITQHQDPASSAASGNKQIALEVAKQIAQLGGDPNLAIGSGTFAPGNVNDSTGKGNTCDVATDAKGCINSQNLLVPDVTKAEIASAVAGISAGKARRADATVNVQTFTGQLGGPAPPVISSAADAKRPFSVDGTTFVGQGAALQRSCSVQHNACATAVNEKKIAGSVSQCETQQAACEAAAGAKRFKKLRRAALDFGACSNPSIKFAAGLDGRKEEAFAPADGAQFNHGSALNIKVISGFICSQLGSKCKAAANAVQACDQAASAANAQTGQAAADAFNSALGV